MKWFDRWFYRQAKKAWDNKDQYEQDHAINLVSAKEKRMNTAMSVEHASIAENGLRFSVLPAQGGTIVELRKYDHTKDRNYNSVHVIPDGEDIAKQIGLIVSMELLRNQ